MVFTADHFNSPEGIQKMQDAVSLGRFSFSIICCMRCLIIKANGRFLFVSFFFRVLLQRVERTI